MEEFIQRHPQAIVYVLSALVVGLISILTWFLKSDRKKFMDDIVSTKEYIKECKDEIEDKILFIEGEVDEVQINYNDKFKEVNNKIDTVKDTINKNHIDMMKVANRIDVKVAELKSRQ